MHFQEIGVYEWQPFPSHQGVDDKHDSHKIDGHLHEGEITTSHYFLQNKDHRELKSGLMNKPYADQDTVVIPRVIVVISCKLGYSIRTSFKIS